VITTEKCVLSGAGRINSNLADNIKMDNGAVDVENVIADLLSLIILYFSILLQTTRKGKKANTHTRIRKLTNTH
jgi:hypothetical protein